MASAKDKCFEAAVDAYQELREQAGSPLSIKVTHQTPWTRDPSVPGSRWRPVKHVFNQWYHIYGYAKRKFGFDMTQVRYPDVTVEMKDGSHIVLDNKFTDKNGNIDKWRDKENEYSKTTQQRDYADINRQQGHDIGEEPSLDKEKCKCDEREKKRELQPQRVPVPNPATQLYFMPYPTNPGQVPIPGRIPMPQMPPIIRPPLIPVFP